MLREQVLREWNTIQQIFAQLKAKSIDNYPKVKKVTLLTLDSIPLRNDDNQPAQGVLYNLQIANGSVTKTATRFKLSSQQGVNLFVEVLEVAILKDLSTDENTSLSNYDELSPIND